MAASRSGARASRRRLAQARRGVAPPPRRSAIRPTVKQSQPGFFPPDLGAATDAMLATSSGKPKLPGTYDRAKQAQVDAGRLVIKSLSSPYVFSYRRLSALSMRTSLC